MIVRNRPPGWRLFFLMTGSVVPKVATRILAVMGVAIIVSLLHGVFFNRNLTFTAVPFTILGLALSIFLGFRNSVAYDRYWEGRKLWGDLLIESRLFARRVFSLMADDPPLQREMVYKTIAFAHALRHHLRDSDAAEDLRPFLGPADHARVMASVHRPVAIIRSLGGDLAAAVQRGLIPPPLAVNLDASLASLDRVLGGCERIKSTPIPFSYTLLLHRTAYLYCFLLPFGLADSVGYATPLVAGLVSYTFFGLDALGDEIEEPFGSAPNDLPLTALCRSIEISLRDSLGETDLPLPLLPVEFALQ